MAATTTDLLRRSELFSELPAAILEKITAICHEVKIAQGEFVFRIGDPSKDLFILAEGAVDLGFGVMLNDDSTEGVIKEPGEMIGWGALVGEANYRMINAICVRETRFITVDGLELMNLLEKNPAAGFSFLRKLMAIILTRMVSIAAS